VKATIILEFEGELANELDARSHADIGLVLRDALGEFIAARTPFADYVAKRYSSAPERFQRDKVRNVAKRCELACSIAKGDVTLIVSEPTPPRKVVRGPRALAEAGIRAGMQVADTYRPTNEGRKP
jgi:hypothetical protein